MNHNHYLVLIAGVFGILSVFFDQKCYRIEKESSDIKTEINKVYSIKEFCFSVNEHLAHIHDEIENLESLFYDFENEQKTIFLGYYNDSKSYLYDLLNDISRNENFEIIKSNGFEELTYTLRQRSSSYDSEYENDSSLFDYTIYGTDDAEKIWYNSFSELINNSYNQWQLHLNKIKYLKSQENSIIYQRQTAIISSMISSIISILLLIIFFKISLSQK